MMKTKKRQINNIFELFVAWTLGLVFGGGLFYTFYSFLGIALGGIATSGSNVTRPSVYFHLILGIGIIFFALILLAVYWSNWRKSIPSAFLGFMLGSVALWLGWIMWGFLLTYLNLLQISEGSLAWLLPGSTATVSIGTLIFLCTPRISQRARGLLIGLSVGLGFSVITQVILGGSILYGDNINIFHILWVIPPLVWVTAVYFVQVARGQRELKEFSIWVFLVVLTISLPFLIVPRLSGALFP